MVHFKRVFSPILRLHPKYREFVCQRAVVTPTAISPTTFIQPRCLRNRGHLKFELTVEDVQPPTDTTLESVKEVDEFDFDFEDDDDSSKTHVDVRVQSTEIVLAEIEQIDKYEIGDALYNEHAEHDDDADELLPSDPVRETPREMPIKRLYTAVAENDRELAALHTPQRDKFSHVVRVVFEPPSRHDGIAPSSWRIEEISPSDGPSELRLTCPAMIPHCVSEMSLLTEKQVLAARNYIAQVLPGTKDVPAGQQEFALKLSPEERENARVLIVGPPDRRIDTTAILRYYVEWNASTSGTGRQGNDGNGRSVFGDMWQRPFSSYSLF